MMTKDSMKKQIMQNSMSSSPQQQQQQDEHGTTTIGDGSGTSHQEGAEDARVDRRLPQNIPQQHYKFMEQRKAKKETQLAYDDPLEQLPSNDDYDDTTDIGRVGAFPEGGTGDEISHMGDVSTVSNQQRSIVVPVLNARVVDREESISLSVPVFEAMQIQDVEPTDTHHFKALLKSRMCRIILALFLVVLIGVIVAFVLLTQNGSKSSPISEPTYDAATSAFLDKLKPLLSNTSLTALDEDPTSPQYQSLQWLLKTSNFESLPSYRLVQRFALATIYYATGGKTWTNSDNWLTNETECNWLQGRTDDGDFCDENGTLLSLNQSSNMLSGTIPDEIQLLSTLTIIDLSGNEISGTLSSADLGSLTALTVLSLADNKLSGTLSSEIASLTALIELSLGSNSFKGSLPSELGSLTALTSLSLEWNSFNGTVPSEVGSLTALTDLSLFSITLTGTLPSELDSLTALNDSSFEKDMAAFPFLMDLRSLLSNESLDALDDIDSPQSLSLRWRLLERSNFQSLPFHQKVQQYALATIYYATGGLTWYNNGNWLKDDTECTWVQRCTDNIWCYGNDVCDANNTLLFLNQSTNTLKGKIPNEIRLLSSLTVIDLSMNQISGTLPSELGALTELTLLSLKDNKLNGTVPSELGSLTALIELSLGMNSFEGPLPSELGSLTRLTSLSLIKSPFKGTLPSELGSLTALTALYLDNNTFTGTLPSELGSLTALTFLSIRTNPFLKGTVPSELGSLTALTYFSMGDNFFTGTLPSEVGSLTALELLDLGLNFFTGTAPSELGSLTALTRLSLNNNVFAGTVPSELGSLTTLTFFSTGDNKLRGTVPSELGSLTALTLLSLTDNELSGIVPSELGSLRALESLELGHNSFTRTLPSELGSMTALTLLSLTDNKLSGTIPSELGVLTALTYLDIFVDKLKGTVPAQLCDLGTVSIIVACDPGPKCSCCTCKERNVVANVSSS